MKHNLKIAIISEAGLLSEYIQPIPCDTRPGKMLYEYTNEELLDELKSRIHATET